MKAMAASSRCPKANRTIVAARKSGAKFANLRIGELSFVESSVVSCRSVTSGPTPRAPLEQRGEALDVRLKLRSLRALFVRAEGQRDQVGGGELFGAVGLPQRVGVVGVPLLLKLVQEQPKQDGAGVILRDAFLLQPLTQQRVLQVGDGVRFLVSQG